MKNLVQIICGCGSAETIEECARVPTILDATIIVVYGIWPRLDHPTEIDPLKGDSSKWLTPVSQVDNVMEICNRNNWIFLQMDNFSYNGAQYNRALNFILENNIPCDHIWFVDGDECIDQENIDHVLLDVEEMKRQGFDSLRFKNRIEILPGWKCFRYNVTGGNYGICTGAALKLRRKEFFDGNFFFESEIPFATTEVPLLHLHHFRRNAAKRIFNNSWHGGGIVQNLDACQQLYDSEYTKLLRSKFKAFFVSDSEDSFYLGAEIYNREC